MLVLVKPVFKTFTFYLNTMLLIMEKRFFPSVSFFLCLFFFLNDTFFTGIESLLKLLVFNMPLRRIKED